MARENHDAGIFGRRPDDDDLPTRYRLLRTPASGRAGGIVISHDLTGTRTHYWHGRTTPCWPAQCEACDEHQPSRWHGYLALMGGHTKEIFLFEFTAAACGQIAQYFDDHRTLRGASLTCFRTPSRPNGRVVVQLTPSSLEKESLPKAPPITKILLSMWGVKIDDPRLTAHPTIAVPMRSNDDDALRHG